MHDAQRTIAAVYRTLAQRVLAARLDSGSSPFSGPGAKQPSSRRVCLIGLIVLGATRGKFRSGIGRPQLGRDVCRKHGQRDAAAARSHVTFTDRGNNVAMGCAR